MKEQNRQTLRDALQQLPIHEVPESAWSYIATQIHASSDLQSRLPQYAAPQSAWENIETALQAPGRSKSIRAWLVAAAATILAMMSISLTGDYHQEVPVEVLNKEVKELPVIARAQLVAFEEEWREEENKMYQCLENLPDSKMVQLRPILASYMDVAHDYDNMRALFPQQDSLTVSQEFVSVEKSRDSLLQLIMKNCE
ncbi:MAG: hypothetical protein AAFP89_21830 [Bacteroidota bacterium]